MKTCVRCGQEQPITNFARRGAEKFRSYCRACDSAYQRTRRDARIQLNAERQTCTKCGGPFSGSVRGNTWCLTCNREFARTYRTAKRESTQVRVSAWKEANRPSVRERSRQADARIKQACFALFGSKCQRCGFADARALQIDHINGAGATDRRSNHRSGKGLYAAILRGAKDRSEFQLLCANCNWIKRYENNECKRRDD